MSLAVKRLATVSLFCPNKLYYQQKQNKDMAQKRQARRKPVNDHWLRRRTVQAIEYQISGDVYFFFGYTMFALLWSVLGWPLFWAKITANFFGWSINYSLQRYWVFGRGVRPTKHVRVTRRYMLITLIDFGLDYLIVAGLRRIGISPY